MFNLNPCKTMAFFLTEKLTHGYENLKNIKEERERKKREEKKKTALIP